MAEYLFDAPEVKAIQVVGRKAAYPINRIFCVGRNYAAHAAEMGNEVDREAPIYFTKFADSAVLSGATIPYPPGTENFHYEMELVVAIGRPVFRVPIERVRLAIFGYACGLDMTRRDLQKASQAKQRPWDTGKNFEGGAVFSPLVEADDVGDLGTQRIHLAVNGETRQDAELSDMIWSVDEIVSDLSRLYHLKPGDVILTGTPAGVDAVAPGDRLQGGIEGIGEIELTIGAPE